MIDFESYEEFKLEDVAEFERARQGHIYPRGASTIQISATRGQVDFLFVDREVHSKEVVIIPQSGINQKYFNIVLRKNIEQFIAKYATGINIQEHEIGNFPIQLHNQETQKAMVKMFNLLDDKMQETQEQIDELQQMKKTMLNQMMV
jgi:hypothetical protein